MTPELRETVARYLDNVPVPPVICSDYSAFDAIAEITGFRVSTREELFESPLPEILTFEATVKFGRESFSQRDAEEMFRKGEKRRDPTYSMEDVRTIIGKASLTGQGIDRKTVVIFDADRLNPEAANAVLKTFEDVPRGTLFLLTVKSRSRMLDTVLSRCLFSDSNDTALEPDADTVSATDAFLRGDIGPLVSFSAKKKPERSKCLAVLTCFGRAATAGKIRDEVAISAISEAYANIATTNVTPYYELDRALLAIAAGMERMKRNSK